MAAVAITVPIVTAGGRQLVARLAYDPVDCPLAVSLAVGTEKLGQAVFPVSRQLAMEAYAHAGTPVGMGGRVQLRVRDPRTTQILLIPQLPLTPQSFYLSTQSLMEFVNGSRTQVPMCLQGVCERVGCFECAWLRRQIPDCSCGVVDCTSFRFDEFPPQEGL